METLTLDLPIKAEPVYEDGHVISVNLYFFVDEKLIPFPDELYSTLSNWDMQGLIEYVEEQERKKPVEPDGKVYIGTKKFR